MEKLPRRVPQGDIDLIGLLTDHFFGDLFDGFGGIGDVIGDIIGNIGNAITGTSAPGTGSPLDSIFDHVLGIQNVGVENSTAIAAINAASGGGSGSGVYFVDTFDRADSASLGSDWIVFDYDSAGIQIAGNMASSRQLATGETLAKCNTLPLGNNMSAAIVAGTLHAGLYTETGLIVRMNDAGTAWVYLNIFKNKVYLGRAVRSGSSVTYTDWVSVTSGISVSTGTQIELRAEGSTYRAYVGGTLVASYTDAAVSHPVGSTTRRCGFQVSNDAIFGKSMAVSSFAMADITVPDTVGTGWSLYRSSTSGSTSTSWTTTGTAFGSDTFDVKDREANVLVDVLGVGRVKILKAGWYTVSVSARTGTARPLAMVGLLGGTVAGSLSLIRVGSVGQDVDLDTSGFTTTSPKNWSGTWTVYCPANYLLAPAGCTQGTSQSVSLVGLAAGYATNFHGALLNPG